MPEIHAVLLAAGLSRRMAPRNKLLIPFAGGLPMVAVCAATVCASRVHAVIVVLGHQADQVEPAVRAFAPSEKLRFVMAGDFAIGLSASLKAGLSALPSSADAVLVCLADMPLLTPAILDHIIAAYPASPIVVPTHLGHRGNPVLWDRRFFADMLALEGDAGARSLLARHGDQVGEVNIETDAILRDIDTPDMV